MGELLRCTIIFPQEWLPLFESDTALSRLVFIWSYGDSSSRCSSGEPLGRPSLPCEEGQVVEILCGLSEAQCSDTQGCVPTTQDRGIPDKAKTGDLLFHFGLSERLLAGGGAPPGQGKDSLCYPHGPILI